jgi:predicted RNA-binding Zn ribbon-like protein
VSRARDRGLAQSMPLAIQPIVGAREQGRSFEVRLRWNGDDWRAVTAIVTASYVSLLMNDDLRRVRGCANPSCSFIFCDDTRNASRRWCDATICGNLIKVRRYRRAISRRGWLPSARSRSNGALAPA